MDPSILKPRPGLVDQPKIQKAYIKLERLLQEIAERKLPQSLASQLTDRITDLNGIADQDPALKKKIRRTYSGMLRTLEKEMKWVPKHYYQTLWTGLGMAAFGVPMGVAFGASLGNMAFLGIGIPIGMAIGIGVGMQMDKKAADEGRQLDL